MTNLIKYTCLTVILSIAGHSLAFAQSQTGSGTNAASTQEAACVDELNRINSDLDEFENFAGRLEQCNANGQTFNGTGCVDIGGLSHEWVPNTTNPTQILLRSKSGVIVKRINVVRGRDGISRTAADCPAGSTYQ